MRLGLPRFLALAVSLATGCDAYFSYERTGLGSGTDLAALADQGQPADQGRPADLSGADMSGVDLAAAVEQVVALGTFEGRGGHSALGSAMVVRTIEGSYELRLGADFRVSGVPGPVVYLSPRAALGSSIDSKQDLEIAPLRLLSGAQSYSLVGLGPNFQNLYVWVWCKPFAIEVARAPLRAP